MVTLNNTDEKTCCCGCCLLIHTRPRAGNQVQQAALFSKLVVKLSPVKLSLFALCRLNNDHLAITFHFKSNLSWNECIFLLFTCVSKIQSAWVTVSFFVFSNKIPNVPKLYSLPLSEHILVLADSWVVLLKRESPGCEREEGWDLKGLFGRILASLLLCLVCYQSSWCD